MQVSDWALRTRFRGVNRSEFGSVTVLDPDGSSRLVADLVYPLEDERRGLRLLPASDEARVVFPDGTEGPGWQQVDEFLRNRSGLGPEDPLYALLSYIHPEEYVGDVAALPRTTKLYLGHRHVGAYQGRGRTTHALSAHSNWRGRGPADMGFNVDRHPANVQLLSLRGVAPATLNRNAVIVDRIIAARAGVPVETDSIEARAIDLNSTLQYYRDLLRGEEYLEDLSWYTNCSVHKMVVVNVLLNLPHNPDAFSETFGREGQHVWQCFRDCYADVFGRPFTPDGETRFTPLWRLEGLPVTAIRPLSLGEYHRYYAAVDEGESTSLYVSTDEGETWTLRYSDRQP